MLFYLVELAFSAQFAVLYAGSGTFRNYRHQADIYTIYNQLLARGFTPKNIGLYAFDDIATDPRNPFIGQVFHSIDHKINVYPGSDAINFKGADVTPEAFYDSITKLPTTSNDYVFIYYDNHGGAGILGTPDIYKDIMADQLAECFNKASASNLYKKCLFFIEACYSGSTGKLLTAPNLATITASMYNESSYSAIYDEQIGTYISNVFTNNFITYIDQEPSSTVGELYEYLQKNTERSHTCYFGDESIQSISLSNFIGTPNKIIAQPVNNANIRAVKPSEATEITLKFLSNHEKASIRAQARIELLRLKAQTEKLEAVLEMLVRYVDPKNYDKIMNSKEQNITKNYFEVLRIFREKFGEINPDDLGKLNVLVSLASMHTKAEIVQGIYAVIV